MTHGNLAAVGKTGFGRRRCLTVEHGHLVPQLLQVIRRGDAEQTGAEDDDFHLRM